MGIPRDNLLEDSKKILAGAELIKLEGRVVTLARIFKIDRPVRGLISLLKEYLVMSEEKRAESVKEIQGLLPVKESEELYMAEYKFAIASSHENLIDEGFRRLEDLDFEYEIFGGNDYHFVDFIGNVRPATVKMGRQARGYCRRNDFEGIRANDFKVTWSINNAQRMPLIMPVTFLANVKEEFISVYGADIIVSRELHLVNDGESQIFVYEAAPFIVRLENV